MFLVFNKEKIYSYIVVLSTVAVLFGVSAIVSKNEKENLLEVSSSVYEQIENNMICENNIESIDK